MSQEVRWTFRQAVTATSAHLAMTAKVWAGWWRTVTAPKPTKVRQ